MPCIVLVKTLVVLVISGLWKGLLFYTKLWFINAKPIVITKSCMTMNSVVTY